MLTGEGKKGCDFYGVALKDFFKTSYADQLFGCKQFK